MQLKDFGSKERIDPAAVTGDIQLPIKRALGITARKYRLQYEVESGGDGACTVDGSRLRVTRPAPGYPDAHDTLVVTVITARKYRLQYEVESGGDGACTVDGSRLRVTRPAPGYPDAHDTLVVTVKSGNVARTRSIDLTVKASDTADIDRELALMQQRTRSIDLTVKASDTADIDRELALMQQVKDGYAQALLGDNARRTRAEVSGTGIVPDSIDLSHPSEQWDKFKSSAPSVIESETLRMLKVPTYNTRVTITSCLKSEKYGDYYERLKDDPSISPVVLEKYRALSRQESEKYGDYYERLKDDPSISPVVLEKYRALSRQEAVNQPRRPREVSCAEPSGSLCDLRCARHDG